MLSTVSQLVAELELNRDQLLPIPAFFLYVRSLSSILHIDYRDTDKYSLCDLGPHSSQCKHRPCPSHLELVPRLLYFLKDNFSLMF